MKIWLKRMASIAMLCALVASTIVLFSHQSAHADEVSHDTNFAGLVAGSFLMGGKVAPNAPISGVSVQFAVPDVSRSAANTSLYAGARLGAYNPMYAGVRAYVDGNGDPQYAGYYKWNGSKINQFSLSANAGDNITVTLTSNVGGNNTQTQILVLDNTSGVSKILNSTNSANLVGGGEVQLGIFQLDSHPWATSNNIPFTYGQFVAGFTANKWVYLSATYLAPTSDLYDVTNGASAWFTNENQGCFTVS